jgi:hypothetical protein
MPTFAFHEPPPSLTTRLRWRMNAPLPLSIRIDNSELRYTIYARLFSAQEHSTGELLRTL